MTNRSTLKRYRDTLVDSYQRGGISEISDEIRRYIKWKWYRTRMHPRYKRVYCAALRAGRRLDSSRFTDANPFKIIYVDPTNIKYRVVGLPYNWGRVIGGDWDLRPFTTGQKYNALKQRFVNGRDWSDIENEVHDKEVWETLYSSIKKQGYKSQRELDQSKNYNDLTWDCEIGVAIDADGEIHWIKRGSHRIRLSKVMKIDSVPVQARVRHPKWQTIRDEICAANAIGELSERARNHLYHPDLQEFHQKLQL